ncbi:hypothetical protein HKX48_003220 [Thoreauomyces humboldtii]|nr:hypothetical protein HKX48_003220 [Thoreauomyces humboldtii]
MSATPPLQNLIDNPIISNLANLKHNFKLDVVACVSAAWKTGYNASHNPGYDAAYNVTRGVYNVTTLEYAHYAWVNVVASPYNQSVDSFSIIDAGNPNVQTGWPVLPITRLPDKTGTPKLFPFSDIIPIPGLMQLGLVPPAVGPVFSINGENDGLVIGYVEQSFWAANESLATGYYPKFFCLGAFQVTTTWIEMMRDAKPLPEAVVAMFESSSLEVLGSSNMVVNSSSVPDPATGVVDYAKAIVDDQTTALQVAMFQRFSEAFQCNPFQPRIAIAQAVVAAEPTFELEVAGILWLMNVDLVLLGTNDYALLLLAIPRTAVSD